MKMICNNNVVEFYSHPKQTHEMEHSCDARKDKTLKGRDCEYPVARITDKLRRGGELRVTSVNSLPSNDNEYSLHANYLCNPPKESGPCNDVGVAFYKFDESFYNEECVALINLTRICIRRSKVIPSAKTGKTQAKQKKIKEETKKSEGELFVEKWNLSRQKFDPFGKGFGDTDDLDYHKIRLCCQIYFSDNTKSDVFLSDTIVNSAENITIEEFFWNPTYQVSEIPLVVEEYVSVTETTASAGLCNTDVESGQPIHLYDQLGNWLEDNEKVPEMPEASPSTFSKRPYQESYLEENGITEDIQTAKRQRFTDNNSMFTSNNFILSGCSNNLATMEQINLMSSDDDFLEILREIELECDPIEFI